MALISINELSIGFHGPPLLDAVTCQIESGQRIGLLGRNGSGKTTLMRILAGQIVPDHGECTVAPGVKVAMLPQEVPRDLAGSINDVVLHAFPPAELRVGHTQIARQRLSERRVGGLLDAGLAGFRP